MFERCHRTIRPTDAGRRPDDHTQRILDIVAETQAAVNGEELAVRGNIRIAASTVPAEPLLPCLWARFRESFPEILESILVSDSRVATEAVASGRADVGVVGEQRPSAASEVTPIANDELVLVVSPRHEWSGKQFIAPHSLTPRPVILREPGFGSRRCVETALRDKGIEFDAVNVTMEVNSNDAIRVAVEQNAGIAFLSATTAAHDLGQGRLVRIGVKGMKPVRQLFLGTHSGAKASRAVCEFIQIVAASQAG